MQLENVNIWDFFIKSYLHYRTYKKLLKLNTFKFYYSQFLVCMQHLTCFLSNIVLCLVLKPSIHGCHLNFWQILKDSYQIYIYEYPVLRRRHISILYHGYTRLNHLVGWNKSLNKVILNLYLLN